MVTVLVTEKGPDDEIMIIKEAEVRAQGLDVEVGRKAFSSFIDHQ